MSRDKDARRDLPLTDYDLHLHGEGRFLESWRKMGAHPGESHGERGVWFSVWAPNAELVSVMGDFNDWSRTANPMRSRGDSGLWEIFVPGIDVGALYKYFIKSRLNAQELQKADPFAFASELRPKSASMVWDLDRYAWNDAEWMETRRRRNGPEAPVAVYEVHLGSWMRVPEEEDRWLTYRELAGSLAAYVKEMGFTHVELLPVTEHPLDGSWGYQCIGYFAPTSRFGSPDDFRYLVDRLHQEGIGVILDWVPAHFPRDGHGLGTFDGSHLYEHADPRQGEHKDWGTFIFNFGRKEVSNFLLSNAIFWLEEYHIDGLRVDAVASLLYLDYSRREGEWIANQFGGRENLEAVSFLRRFNEIVYQRHPDIVTMAEESTSWPMVSRPTYTGGLGFGCKWNMGWMHDTLSYMSQDPVFRKYHHNTLTFSQLYAYHENFILPLSHDEVVHGKGSLLSRMPGDDWSKLANLRLLFGLMYTHPGKKLLFMGGEFGQWAEWDSSRSLDWHLLENPGHKGVQRWVRDLNTLMRAEPALHEKDFSPDGFQWIDCHDSEQSTLSFLRRNGGRERELVCICNFTPVARHNYRVGVPREGLWEEALNSDATLYGGGGRGNLGAVETTPVAIHGFYQSVNITLPPLGVIILRGKTG